MSSKYSLIKHIGELYQRGENVIKYLKAADNRTFNTTEDILISYDFQAGSYTKSYLSNPEYRETFTSSLADILKNLGDFETVLEAGCGEATNLIILARHLPSETRLGGFDLSWSRVKVGQDFARTRNLLPTLFCGDLFNIPLADKSVDVVYTSHSIEPNGGREAEAIAELARVARKWLVLLEPAYDMASKEARARMEEHGYVKDLGKTIANLGLHLQESRLFPVCSNPLNPTGLYLVRLENTTCSKAQFEFRCPVSKLPMALSKNAFFSRDSLLAYPILEDVPCLLEGNAILATKFENSSVA